MKILIIMIAFIVFLLFVYGLTDKVKEIRKQQGQLNDIEKYIIKLMTGNNPHGFLIIEVSGTEDFIQFSVKDKGVQLDFPIVTKRQKELQTKFWECARELNLQVIENKGTDRSTFLDIDLNDSPSEISEVVKEMMFNLFGVSENSKLEFLLDI